MEDTMNHVSEVLTLTCLWSSVRPMKFLHLSSSVEKGVETEAIAQTPCSFEKFCDLGRNYALRISQLIRYVGAGGEISSISSKRGKQIKAVRTK